VIDGKQALSGLNGQWNPKPVAGVKLPKTKPLTFAQPDLTSTPPSLAMPHHLQTLLESAAAKKTVKRAPKKS